MFSKNNPEKEVKPTNFQTSNETENEDYLTEIEEIESQSLIKLVEKISSILSPYFIVIVGLYLYDNNFLFGSILILIGILSLLKISYEDIWKWVEKIKNLKN